MCIIYHLDEGTMGGETEVVAVFFLGFCCLFFFSFGSYLRVLWEIYVIFSRLLEGKSKYTQNLFRPLFLGI